MNLSPFRKLLITVGNLPTAYIESMSYYEGLCYLVNYIVNNIDPNVKQNSEAIEELQNYVKNYFDNLDVQEEINNKLDDMAESGELAEIINVEMIGSLSDLTTTDKTSIVNAINENTTNINNLNITEYHTYTTFQVVTGTGTITNGSITVAKSSSGTICKIYGYLNFSGFEGDGAEAVVRLNSDTGLRPTTSFQINNAGLGITANLWQLNDCYIRVNTNGTLDFISYMYGDTYFKFLPCIYFVKDFGDQ